MKWLSQPENLMQAGRWKDTRIPMRHGEAPAKPLEDTSELLNPETEKWQAGKDAKVFCAKEGKDVC
jgi:hypothetical protein